MLKTLRLSVQHHKLFAKAFECQWQLLTRLPQLCYFRALCLCRPLQGRCRCGVGDGDAATPTPCTDVCLSNSYTKFVLRSPAHGPLRPQGVGAGRAAELRIFDGLKVTWRRCYTFGTRRGRCACSLTPPSWLCRHSWSSLITLARSILSPPSPASKSSSSARTRPKAPNCWSCSRWCTRSRLCSTTYSTSPSSSILTMPACCGLATSVIVRRVSSA